MCVGSPFYVTADPTNTIWCLCVPFTYIEEIMTELNVFHI